MEHISVCICTFKRPVLLKQLLEKLVCQRTEDQFSYSIVIVDNDCNRSALPVVTDMSHKIAKSIQYVLEPRQNIALARNKAVETAYGSYLAFIDDDEFPSNDWLLNLYTAFKKYKVNGGVLGPVIPYYPNGTPHWIIKSQICDRPNHLTGTILDWNMTRSGNVLISRRVVSEDKYFFDAKYGRTGGEDKEFFRMLMQHGFTFIWCNEAKVYEVIYPERWKLSHYLQRNLMNGGVTGEEIGKYSIRYFVRSIGSLICYTALLCGSVLNGKHKTYKYLIKVVYDFARVLGCLGIVFARERKD